MSLFGRALRKATAGRGPRGRRWVYVPYDQLTDRIGPLSETAPGELGIVLVESPAKAARRPYHRQKLALILANQRRFALEQADRGVAVRYETVDGPFRDALGRVAADVGELVAMRPAERELREDLRPRVQDGSLRYVDHAGWWTTAEQFRESQGDGPPWRMDAFYRHVRRRTGILMEDAKPTGGRFSFDAENRRPWRGDPPAAEPPTFEPDAIVREVGDLIRERFDRHPGRLDLARLPASAEHARATWDWARRACLPHFGPYEDAMSVRSTTLFHTRISALVHLHRLLPRQVVEDVLDLDVPLASKEGFVRQVLGWREFMRHVHEATDGFRAVPDTETAVRSVPGDGGWSDHAGEAWSEEPSSDGTVDGGAAPSFLGGDRHVPRAFWGRASGLHCLDTVVASVWDEGYGHHITRLMVLANLATLIDVSPRELTDWFWVAYTDAYDWVVEPNVLGMGTFGLGDLFTTKPYVSGAAYVDRMGDYCSRCAFDPKTTCPITGLYWAFLARHAAALRGNPRMSLPLRSLERRSEARRRDDVRTYARVTSALARGATLRPG